MYKSNSNLSNHSMILVENKLYGFGSNEFGQLGIDDINDQDQPVLIMQDDEIKSVQCGSFSTFVLRKNGQLLCCGYNLYGELGLGHREHVGKFHLLMEDPQIKSIHCGGRFAMILKKNGEVYAFGKNRHGQLGILNGDYQNKPVLTMTDPEIKNIYCGVNHTFIHKFNGELYVMGLNNKGQLGLGNTENKSSPQLFMQGAPIKMVALGGYHSIVYNKNGDVFSFGNNFYGQLGMSVKEKDINTPHLLMNDNTIKSITCGSFHTFLQKKNGDIICFGNNLYGQLGIGKVTKHEDRPYLMKNGTDIKTINCGSFHTMFLKENGELFVYGSNSSGQLGIKGKENKASPTFLMKFLSNPLFLSGNLMDWSPKTHKLFPTSFKDSVLLFLLCLKRYQPLLSFKFPKPVIYFIVRSLDPHSFGCGSFLTTKKQGCLLF